MKRKFDIHFLPTDIMGVVFHINHYKYYGVKESDRILQSSDIREVHTVLCDYD